MVLTIKSQLNGRVYGKVRATAINFAQFYLILTKTCVTMTEEAILKALSNVQEPDLGKDLVTLNMVKDVQINGNDVSFTIVLTTPACPMKDMMRTASENAVKLLVNKEANVKVNFTANTSSTRKDNAQILSGVKNIIAVVSGKGGVGKSTVGIAVGAALATLAIRPVIATVHTGIKASPSELLGSSISLCSRFRRNIG